jgi:hypothetical protein
MIRAITSKLFKRKKYRSKFFEDMGLVIGTRGAMCYGMEHGHLRWAPDWVKHGICTAWNWCACRVKGHDPIGASLYTSHMAPGPPTCVNCGATMKINGRYPTDAELDAHDDLCYERFEKEFPELSQPDDQS